MNEWSAKCQSKGNERLQITSAQKAIHGKASDDERVQVKAERVEELAETAQ